MDDRKELLTDVVDLVKQRDDLLSALSAMLTEMGMDENEWNKPTFNQARSAIASVYKHHLPADRSMDSN